MPNKMGNGELGMGNWEWGIGNWGIFDFRSGIGIKDFRYSENYYDL
ncbi:MAG: hypothetical protein HC942_14285 [Microcoleus sp. SU_5_6]|nr:hypothetical protein [Microcoleus sp. SU_5_6]